MRLLMTTDTVGGVWTFTSELASELLARGCDVALVAFGRATSPDQSAWVTELAIRFPSFFFAVSNTVLEWMPENIGAYSGGEALLLELCEAFQPEALLLSQFCFGALPIDVPKIVIAHSDVLSWADAVGKAPLADDEWLRNYCALVQRGLDGADAVVAPTRAMLSALCAHFAVPRRADVISNGRTLPPGQNAGPRKLQAITAGRMWDEAKNLRLLADCPSPMPILIAGENTGVEVKNGSLTMLGRQSERKLFAHFQQSAIYICSSVYEPFGLAALEAALCGCAVLANDIHTLHEVWGNAALYFKDPASLSFLLTELSKSSDQLVAAQKKSHARALTFSSARMADQYLHLVEQVTTTHARSVVHAA